MQGRAKLSRRCSFFCLQDTLALPADTSIDLLQLAFNCKEDPAATAAAQRLPAQLNADVARKLLTTAAQRWHAAAVLHMAGHGACKDSIQQHIDAPTLEIVLLHMTFDEACVNVLCRLPAAALLTSDALEKIIWEAFEEDFILDRRSAVYRLPAAACISSSAVLKMLEYRVNNGNYDWVEAMCSLPLAQQLSIDEVKQLLQEALTYETECCVGLLCQLPAAAQLDTSTIEQLLERAIENCTKRLIDDAPDCVEHLCRLPAAADISSSAMVELLQAALLEEHAILMHKQPVYSDYGTRYHEVHADFYEHLCQLPCALQLSHPQVQQLLLQAVRLDSVVGMKMLLQLSAVEQMGSALLRELMEAAITHRSVDCAVYICRWSQICEYAQPCVPGSGDAACLYCTLRAEC
jgi:hypothetical protein